jgi:hypothetical protein
VHVPLPPVPSPVEATVAVGVGGVAIGAEAVPAGTGVRVDVPGVVEVTVG